MSINIAIAQQLIRNASNEISVVLQMYGILSLAYSHSRRGPVLNDTSLPLM